MFVSDYFYKRNELLHKLEEVLKMFMYVFYNFGFFETNHIILQHCLPLMLVLDYLFLITVFDNMDDITKYIECLQNRNISCNI